jgi:hypothetical protein
MPRWLAAALIAGLAGTPGPVAAKTSWPAMAGGYDGAWSVVIVTQAGTCDQSYSFPVRIVGGRVQSNGMADVSGMVGPGGSVAVRVSAGGSYATGSGRLNIRSGAGRWSGRGSTGVCSGRWEATRS